MSYCEEQEVPPDSLHTPNALLPAGGHCNFLENYHKHGTLVYVCSERSIMTVPIFPAKTVPHLATRYTLRVGLLLLSFLDGVPLVLIEKKDGRLALPMVELVPGISHYRCWVYALMRLTGKKTSTWAVQMAVVESVPAPDVHEVTKVYAARLEHDLPAIPERASWMTVDKIQESLALFQPEFHPIFTPDFLEDARHSTVKRTTSIAE